jgi:hypothetical protein
MCIEICPVGEGDFCETEIFVVGGRFSGGAFVPRTRVRVIVIGWCAQSTQK